MDETSGTIEQAGVQEVPFHEYERHFGDTLTALEARMEHYKESATHQGYGLDGRDSPEVLQPLVIDYEKAIVEARTGSYRRAARLLSSEVADLGSQIASEIGDIESGRGFGNEEKTIANIQEDFDTVTRLQRYAVSRFLTDPQK